MVEHGLPAVAVQCAGLWDAVHAAGCGRAERDEDALVWVSEGGEDRGEVRVQHGDPGGYQGGDDHPGGAMVQAGAAGVCGYGGDRGAGAA
ncbi:hypothetical protein CCP3SC1AL1_4240002 [Gammaproteobacteria bacterium]